MSNKRRERGVLHALIGAGLIAVGVYLVSSWANGIAEGRERTRAMTEALEDPFELQLAFQQEIADNRWRESNVR